MIIVRYLGTNALAYYIVIFLVGILLGGPYNNISSAMVIVLAENPKIKGNKEAVSTITSLIEGFASLSSGLM